VQFWSNLSSRERTILSVVVPLSIVVFGYLYYWQPARQSLDQLRVEVPQKAADLAWVKHELDSASEWLSAGSTGVSSGPILTIIENRAIQAGIKHAIQRVQPTGTDNVRIWFKEVLADQWLAFVKLLLNDGVIVDSATLTRGEKGNIDARVTFIR